MIALVLTGRNLDQNLRLIEEYRPYIDLCELRTDYLDSIDPLKIRDFPRRAGLPLILTLRRVSDGGHCSLDEAERQELLGGMISADYAYVDLEGDLPAGAAEARAREEGVRIIRSAHDFSGVPEDFPQVIADLPRAEGEIPKFAAAPRGIADLRRMINAMMTTPSPHIIIGMGPFGFPNRILAGRYGGLLSFCSPEGESAAPGHISPRLLAELYGYRKITPATRLYGLIGNPALHSRSPGIHNPAYKRDGVDAVYIPFQVDDPAEWMQLAGELGVDGFSVTVPHKEAVIPFLDSSDPAVDAIGACNTVVRSKGCWRGSNTDVDGFLAPLSPFLDDPAGRLSALPRRAVVIGAGGAAKAALWALKSRGFEVLILNRTLKKAEELAERFGMRAAALGSESFPLVAEYAELVVQTTPAGMHPLEELNPLEGYPWRGGEIAYDLIYVPERTRFLEAAATGGASIINGESMLQAQAEAQYRLFTGRDFPKL